VRDAPRNVEMPREALEAFITPASARFVRTNFGVPRLGSRSHRMEVAGAVERPLTLRVADLRELGRRTAIVTTECAGNHRTTISPLPPGEPWMAGAVSTASFTGVPLAAVLERAGVRPDSVEVLVQGADEGRVGAADARFARSLPLDKALDPGTLLALEMNGRPLAAAHGAPIRLVVPGWYGMASVKWVARIEVLTAPFAGYFQAERYVFVDASGARRPVREMRVKSLFSSPAPGSPVPPRPLLVSGFAWSGAGRVTRVQVAFAGGGEWLDARLTGPEEKYAWRRWELTWIPPWRGRHVLRCRATDEAGNVQPDLPEWNALGYCANGVQSLVVDIR